MGSVLGETLFGPGSTPNDWALGVFFLVVFAGGLVFVGWVILQLLRASQTKSTQAVERILKEVLSRAPTVDEGVPVELRFTVYTMFLLWGNQMSVQVRLPYWQARAALGKMLRHNLSRGWLGPGGVFVPVLTLIEYAQQRRSLTRQVRAVPPSSSGN
jgi:hypothetical protein